MNKKRLIASASLMLFAATSEVSATDYFLKPGGTPYGVNWTNPLYWYTQPDGTGTNPTAYPGGFSGNNFITNGNALRLNATSFAGASLKVGPSWPDKKDMLILKYLSGTATIPVLYSEGGAEFNQGENVTSNVHVETFHNKIGTTLYTAGEGKGIALSVGTLLGSGDFPITGGGFVKFGAANAGAFTGDIKWGTNEGTRLEFTSDFTSGGKLVVSANGRLNLHQNVTFKSVVINGTPLTPGTHTYAALKAAFPNQILDGGSGSIVAQTSPAADLDITGYNLVFRDEFDGPLSISNWGPGTKWIAHKPDGGDFGYGVFTYGNPQPNPYSITNGILSIRAWWHTDSRWHAGLLSSIARNGYGFAQRYGYFECRMKFPNKSYAWPAFWLLSTGAFEVPTIRTAELDVVEWYGNKPTTAFTTTHRWGTTHGQVQQSTTMQNITADYHVYGVKVTPEAITYYIDGQRVFQHPNFPEAQTPLFPLVNYALHVTPPSTEQGVTSYTDVDYVRVYEAPAEVSGLLPRSGYTIYATSSADPLNPAAHAVDGDYMTAWTSAPGVAKPHEIKLDLGGIRTVSGIRYLPRQSTGTLDGLIQNYEVLVSSNGTSWTTAATGAWSASPLEKTATFPAQNVRYISLKDVGTGTLTAAAEINVLGTGGAPQTLPTTSADVGSPSLAGSTTEAGGTYTIRASGADISGNQDQFRFVYRQLTGDGQITARVNSLTRVNDWAKAGVMMRANLSNNAANVLVCMTGHSQQRYQWRTATSQTTNSTGAATTFPQWVRIVRAGNTFTGYSSLDGVNWIQVGSSNITMGSTIYVGMAVTSHTNSQLTTAILDNVSW